MFIVKACCISLFLMFLMPKTINSSSTTDQLQLNNKMKNIHFRKCCKQNEIYEYDGDKCVADDEMSLSRKRYPINSVHDDFSA